MSNWKDYNSGSKDLPARPRLLKTLEQFCSHTPAGSRALDLGCGSGRDTLELLKRGWSVDAVDVDPDSLDFLTPLKKAYPGLSTILSDFKELPLAENAYDLINASFSLPFCHPSAFADFWSRLVHSLRPGGLISCELFGINDDWNQDPTKRSNMTFLNRQEVEVYLQDLKTILLKEDEHEGPTAYQGPKHWHLFTCIARRP